ncbi:MAG: thiol-disulfide isomerase/thioredoxin [Flavobacteriales bacterium]|jgi:thiol-disulfide isomerase/thioredoxin
MKRQISIGIALCLSIFFAAGIFIFSSTAHSTPYTTIDNKTLNVNLDAPEQATLLIIWASWCPTCRAEIPELKALHKATKGVQFIGVNINKDPADGLHVQDVRDLTYQSISNPNRSFLGRYGLRGTPGFVLIHANGTVLHASNRLAQAKQAIKKHLASQ